MEIKKGMRVLIKHYLLTKKNFGIAGNMKQLIGETHTVRSVSKSTNKPGVFRIGVAGWSWDSRDLVCVERSKIKNSKVKINYPKKEIFNPENLI